MDGQNPAPPEQPWNDDFRTNNFKVVRNGFRASTEGPKDRKQQQHWLFRLPIFALTTSPPPKDTQLSWAKKAMFKTTKKG